MALEDDVKGTAQEVSGKAKEVAGDVTGNDKLKAEGKADGLMGKAKEAFGDVKDKVADAVEDVKEKFDKD